MPARLSNPVKILATFVAALALQGCALLGSEPGPDIGIDPTRIVGAPLSILEEDRLQIVLGVDGHEFAVGDEFHWWAKLDNPTLKDMSVRFVADDPTEVLRVDQTGALVEPITGANIARIRAGLRNRKDRVHGDLRGKRELTPMNPQVIEGTGKVVEGKNGQILIQFEEVEIVLPGRGEYDVYIPVLVQMWQRYTLGRNYTISEEGRSNIERIVIR